MVMVVMNLHIISGIVICIFGLLHFGQSRSTQYGAYVGKFNNDAYNISGDVYVADQRTIFIKNFTYDGRAKPSFFWVGTSGGPSPNGKVVPYPDNMGREPIPLKTFSNTDVVLKLPSNIDSREIRWLSVWGPRFAFNFGSVYFPHHLKIPSPRVLPEFSRLAHGLRSDNITILDKKTFYIPNLHYDGGGPDAYFWVGTGKAPSYIGIKVPNEMNSTLPLRGYEGVDIEIVLPGNLTVDDIDWLSVWCVKYSHNFGHVMIPKDLDVPPALGQTEIATSSTPAPELSNCIELMNGRIHVQWEIFDEDVHVRVSARIRENQYVAFGLSGRDGASEMINADIVVVGYNKNTGKFIADDYYMSDKSQCDGERGVCPDHRVGGKNDAVLIRGEKKNGVTSVLYKRPLRTNEPALDKMIPNEETSVIAAIGELNSLGEANAHLHSDTTNEDIRIDFSSRGVHRCPSSLHSVPDAPDVEPWPAMKIAGVDTFTARIGPTGGARGYSRITGLPSWGIAWYINDMLVPEITVERGRNYTFIVEGGNDPTYISRYHPLYITDSPEGGFAQKNEVIKTEQKIFAGVERDRSGYVYPTALGHYCEWKHKTTDQSLNSESFESFFDTLTLECEAGEPAKLVWFVEESTPDTVYYQCYTHKNMGWKINVVDEGYGALSSESSANLVLPMLFPLLILNLICLHIFESLR